MISTNKRIVAVFLLVVFVTQLITPTISWALTSGPTQPEVQSFQPAGVTEMVDLFSGDFSYNIPLFELPGPNGGYPFNLSYQSGITMDQEASWVGLGWTLQPGAITRQMRGLPDEFKGDKIKTTMSIDPSVTVGLGVGVGIELFGGDLSLGTGLSFYKNSYKGAGYSIDGNVGIGGAVKGMTGSLSLGFSLDSKEGVGVNPSLNLGGKTGQFGLSAGYNSKQGLTSVSWSASAGSMMARGNQPGAKKRYMAATTISAPISISNPGYTPQISMPMKNISLSATFKIGAAWWGIYPSAHVTGFYNEQWLDKHDKETESSAFGYLNYQYKNSGDDVMDFNREKDGMVSKETPNLAIPSLTYDIYSVTGQGIGLMYRPFRNDNGIIHDPETTSTSNAVGVGIDVGPTSHFGANLSVNHSRSTSGLWSEGNNFIGVAGFLSKAPDALYEPVYFKVHGETTSEKASKLNDIGGERAARVKLPTIFDIDPKLEPRGLAAIAAPDKDAVYVAEKNNRASRNQVVQEITNEQLGDGSFLPHYKVKYIEGPTATADIPFTRDVANKQHHIAGYTATTAEGLRYVYGIPAYNKKHEEYVFSIAGQANGTNQVSVGEGDGNPSYKPEGTDKYFKKTSLPEYAHSHLLTSILGPDYVDLTGDGVTNDDLGYWVKFTYRRTTQDYKWRDPFIDAHVEQGWRTDPRDDKGSYTYGEKELWYLAKAETKSHVAEFILRSDDRLDGRGVNFRKQKNTSILGEKSYALDRIELYSKNASGANAALIKTTRFDYDYSLCDGGTGVPNNVNDGGKLTLTKMWFEYGGSTRGSLNPYTFTYAIDRDYNVLSYDRWGTYKPNPDPVNQPFFNNDFPYAEQDPLKKTEIDQNAAAWSLTQIVLPSGGTIKVDYESDDYAYVQNKTAMQMTSIVDPYSPSTGSLDPDFNLSQSNYKIRFKLEKRLPGTLSDVDQKNEVLKYLDTKTWQLFFKLSLNLRRPNDGWYEYISGYANIDTDKLGVGDLKLEKDAANNEFVYGCFYVKSEGGRHPFSRRAWQHLRTNQPELANEGGKVKQEKDPGKRVEQIKSLGSVGTQLRQMFKGFNDYCDMKDWGKQVEASKSWIRLNSPDKIKYGGGLRVKQITMIDDWSENKEGIYGQVYDYTTIEGSNVISSGVASYEPIVGGEENALRYAKKYTQSIPMRSDNNLFFEYPSNESNYPGAQVGYSKVTVMSLASAALAGKDLLNTEIVTGTPATTKQLFPHGTGISYGTTGKTEHEFYTAKEFPVITDETTKDNEQSRSNIIVPLIGTLSFIKLTSTQGYSIITNDMHGKQKAVSNYRQGKNGEFEKDAISWVRYNYRSDDRTINGENVKVLNNLMVDEGNNLLYVPETTEDFAKENYYLGQESEFFYDMRQYEDNAWGGGSRYQNDIIYVPIMVGVVPIPIPTAWPSIGKTRNLLRIVTTNKVIFKAGILKSVEAFDGGSTVTTENIKWDKQTGAVVLSSVDNDYDDPVFSFTIPAFREYQGMGAAFQNTGVTFEMKNVQRDPYKAVRYQFQHALPEGTLMPGDEILLYATSALSSPITRAIYMGEFEEDEIFHSDQILTATNYFAMVVRSGYRNQLSVSAGTITALQDPSKKENVMTYNKSISVPK